MTHFQRVLFYSTFCLWIFFTGCGTQNDEDQVRYYRFTHEDPDVNYTFVAKTSKTETIRKVEQELQKPFEERRLHINGPIERGTEEYNPDWSWHFVENKWELVSASIEVCDGRPSFVEEELDYWVENVGRFCPFSSRVEKAISR